MGKLISLVNPLKLTEEEILKYLKLAAKAGKAHYDLLLSPSSQTFGQWLGDEALLDNFKMNLDERSGHLTFEEILPSSLLQEKGYFFWQGKTTYRGADIHSSLIGKVIESGSLSSSRIKQYSLISTKSDSFPGLMDFHNYRGEYQPAIFNAGELLLVKEALERHNEDVEAVIERSIALCGNMDNYLESCSQSS